MEHAWYALVEENATIGGMTMGDSYAWRLSGMIPLPAGVAIADLTRDVALRFQPIRPAMPRRRSVFRITELSWLVRIEGASSVHHFRVTAAEHIAEMDADGRPITADLGSSIEE